MTASATVAAALLLASCANPPPVPPAGTAPGPALSAFLATGTVHWIDTGPGGAQQAFQYDTRYARDSRGRTRIEGTLPGQTTTDASGNPVPLRVVAIHDPVAHADWLLYPDRKTGYERSDGNMLNIALSASGWLNSPVFFGEGRPTTQSLGQRSVAGIAADGFLTTYSGPAAGGTASEERWRSRDLGNLTLSLRRTAADGTVLYSFTADSVTMGDPPASLFAPGTTIAVRDVRASHETAVALFRAARDSARNLPGALGASELADVAQDEMMAMRQDPDWVPEARHDAVAAFQNLEQTPFPHPTAPATGMLPPLDVKEQLETQMVRDLLMPSPRPPSADEEQQVLDLIRGADVRKAPLYDALLNLTGFRQNAASPLFSPVALAVECEQADGSFPYQGVMAVTRIHGVIGGPNGEVVLTGADPGQTKQLMEMAFEAITGDRDPAGLREAIAFLQQTTPRTPSSDRGRVAAIDYSPYLADWISAAQTLLRNHPVAANPFAMGLLADLQNIDSQAAAGLGAAPTPELLPARQPVNPAKNPLSPQSIRQDPADALAAAQNQTGQQQLNTYIFIASFAAATDPAIAVQALNAASAVSAADSTSPNTQTSLALAYFRLGMADQAEALVAKILDRAAQDAQSAQDRYDQLSLDQRIRTRFTATFGPSASEFRGAAQIDFPAAAAAAQALQASEVRPLALAAVAAMVR